MLAMSVSHRLPALAALLLSLACPLMSQDRFTVSGPGDVSFDFVSVAGKAPETGKATGGGTLRLPSPFGQGATIAVPRGAATVRDRGEGGYDIVFPGGSAIPLELRGWRLKLSGLRISSDDPFIHADRAAFSFRGRDIVFSDLELSPDGDILSYAAPELREPLPVFGNRLHAAYLSLQDAEHYGSQGEVPAIMVDGFLSLPADVSDDVLPLSEVGLFADGSLSMEYPLERWEFSRPKLDAEFNDLRLVYDGEEQSDRLDFGWVRVAFGADEGFSSSLETCGFFNEDGTMWVDSEKLSTKFMDSLTLSGCSFSFSRGTVEISAADSWLYGLGADGGYLSAPDIGLSVDTDTGMVQLRAPLIPGERHFSLEDGVRATLLSSLFVLRKAEGSPSTGNLPRLGILGLGAKVFDAGGRELGGGPVPGLLILRDGAGRLSYSFLPGKVMKPGCRLLSAPREGAEEIAVLPYATPFAVLGSSEGWTDIGIADGSSGWCKNEFLDLSRAAK